MRFELNKKDVLLLLEQNGVPDNVLNGPTVLCVHKSDKSDYLLHPKKFGKFLIVKITKDTNKFPRRILIWKYYK